MERIQYGSKTSNDERCRDMSSEETHDNMLDVAEMRTLRWMSGVT